MRLRVPTIAESLKQQTGGAAKVVSISVKDRSALLSVGRAAELVLWYDSKLGRFTSSSVWGPALSPWVERFQSEHPLQALLQPWHALSAEEYARRLGPDAAPGEGDFDGFGTTFPHGFERVQKPWAALSITPQLSEYLIALTDAAIVEHGIGQDETPDLVALSISGTDSAGHIFGPDSWEYVDHLVRVDRALGAWLSRIENSIPISVLITSDHGVAPMPETRPGQGGRIFPEEMRKRVEASLTRKFGRGPWLAGVMAPYVFLSAQARVHPRAAELSTAALAALRREPWLRDAWLLSEVRGWKDSRDLLESSLALSVAPETSADIVFVSHPYQVLDLHLGGKGTNHGSPYDYDRYVPVLAWGVGVPALRRSEPVNQLGVAPTLAALLQSHPPESAALPPLF
jgi:predicted AlkP superfamily pyrophosphatase or phosphodiesterase